MYYQNQDGTGVWYPTKGIFIPLNNGTPEWDEFEAWLIANNTTYSALPVWP